MQGRLQPYVAGHRGVLQVQALPNGGHCQDRVQDLAARQYVDTAILVLALTLPSWC